MRCMSLDVQLRNRERESVFRPGVVTRQALRAAWKSPALLVFISGQHHVVDFDLGFSSLGGNQVRIRLVRTPGIGVAVPVFAIEMKDLCLDEMLAAVGGLEYRLDEHGILREMHFEL